MSQLFADAPLLPATCLHAALFPPFPGLEVPECPPFRLMPTAGNLDSAPSPLINLPFSPQEARACLAELRNLDADALSQELQRTVEHRGRSGLPAHEAAALARFSGASGADGSESRLRQAQTLLLMVWVQEERLLEIAELSRRCARGEKKLAVLLGDTDAPASPEALHETEAGPDADLLALLPAWPFVLEQLSLFLPADAVLCVTHPDLAARLQDSGRLAPYPGGLCGRFSLRELSRRPGMTDGEYLFILPNKVLA